MQVSNLINTIMPTVTGLSGGQTAEAAAAGAFGADLSAALAQPGTAGTAAVVSGSPVQAAMPSDAAAQAAATGEEVLQLVLPAGGPLARLLGKLLAQLGEVRQQLGGVDPQQASAAQPQVDQPVVQQQPATTLDFGALKLSLSPGRIELRFDTEVQRDANGVAGQKAAGAVPPEAAALLGALLFSLSQLLSPRQAEPMLQTPLSGAEGQSGGSDSGRLAQLAGALDQLSHSLIKGLGKSTAVSAPTEPTEAQAGHQPLAQAPVQRLAAEVAPLPAAGTAADGGAWQLAAEPATREIKDAAQPTQSPGVPTVEFSFDAGSLQQQSAIPPEAAQEGPAQQYVTETVSMTGQTAQPAILSTAASEAEVRPATRLPQLELPVSVRELAGGQPLTLRIDFGATSGHDKLELKLSISSHSSPATAIAAPAGKLELLQDPVAQSFAPAEQPLPLTQPLRPAALPLQLRLLSPAPQSIELSRTTAPTAQPPRAAAAETLPTSGRMADTLTSAQLQLQALPELINFTPLTAAPLTAAAIKVAQAEGKVSAAQSDSAAVAEDPASADVSAATVVEQSAAGSFESHSDSSADSQPRDAAALLLKLRTAATPSGAQPAAEHGAPTGQSATAAPLSLHLAQFATAPQHAALEAEAAVPASRLIAGLERVAREFFSQGEGEHQATINLDPPSLGKLQVNVNVQGNVVALQIGTTTAAARRELREGIAGLKQSLTEAGLSVADIEVVELDAQTDGSNADGGQPEGEAQRGSALAEQLDYASGRGSAAEGLSAQWKGLLAAQLNRGA